MVGLDLISMGSISISLAWTLRGSEGGYDVILFGRTKLDFGETPEVLLWEKRPDLGRGGGGHWNSQEEFQGKTRFF